MPEFQFKVKISEDKGHKDSVIIGYDPVAIDNIDTSSREVLIPHTTSFHSVFEARARVINSTLAGYDYYRYLYVILEAQDQTHPELKANIYPNPAQNEVKVTIAEPAWCHITDMSDKTIQNTYLQAGTNVLEVNNIAKGLYIIRL